jgi:DNA mismatch repair protein MutS
VIKTAKRYLVKLEQESIGREIAGGQLQQDLFLEESAITPGVRENFKNPKNPENHEKPENPSSPLEHPVLAMLRAIAPDDLTPKQALEELYVLKKAARKQ